MGGNNHSGSHKYLLPPFRFTCRVEVQFRVLIWCLFGHSAVGVSMFCTHGNAGASYLGTIYADSYLYIFVTTLWIGFRYEHWKHQFLIVTYLCAGENWHSIVYFIVLGFEFLVDREKRFAILMILAMHCQSLAKFVVHCCMVRFNRSNRSNMAVRIIF